MQRSVKFLAIFTRKIRASTLIRFKAFTAERRARRRNLPPLSLTYKFTNQ
jgi:hypothetical protein